MHIDNARELKHTLTQRLPNLGIRPDAEPWMGFGVSPRDEQDEHKLSVRVPDQASVGDALTQVAEEARDEIEVREVGPIEPQHSINDLRSHCRPLVPGCSVAHRDVTAGTLGGFVTIDGQTHILSNNHVLAHSDLGEPGDSVLQPGLADGGHYPGDDVATLTNTVNLTALWPNYADAAAARVAPGVPFTQDYPCGQLGDPLTEAPADDTVEKIGRTTGHTIGGITAFEVDGLPVPYPEGRMFFHDQIEICGHGGMFSTGGDSGSIIWSRRQQRPVGLLFAGSTRGGPAGTGVTYANLLATALRELGATWGGHRQIGAETATT